jgi:methylated-DNA-[protein]-cysteine S-methyltransferase
MSPTCTRIDSPIGPLGLAVDDDGLVRIQFHAPAGLDWAGPDARPGTHALIDRTSAQLREYFDGRRREFDLPLSPRGTPFQRTVWSELARIPYGAAISYAQLAQRIGKPAAMRAVGAANGRNPLPIVVPCHRVIGADGSLTGFGGGLPTKAFLLRLEGVLAPDLLAVPHVRAVGHGRGAMPTRSGHPD